ncbi:hypothetical protein MKW98_029298 [Papaver atlanticum]|uniref:Nuclear pore protein n=1 Tax=Papaver atlanticum TaxID=357466 RepID=A0AAD4SHM5_9MAGN|nr:hypothetical protein MKW98_029298 [Papaver atlanticum]
MGLLDRNLQKPTDTEGEEEEVGDSRNDFQISYLVRNRPSQFIFYSLNMSTSDQPSDSKKYMDKYLQTNVPTYQLKTDLYKNVVRDLNDAREWGFEFKPATAFKEAYEALRLDISGGKVTMLKIWHLIQALLGEDLDINPSASMEISLVIGARRHLELIHRKYILDKVETDPTQAARGGVGDLYKIHAFLRILLRNDGVLDIDATDGYMERLVDTTWQQIFFCLRFGYYDEARYVAVSSRASHQFAAQLAEWISTGGTVSQETAAAAAEEFENMLMIGGGLGLSEHEKKKLLLHAIISGSRKHIEWLSKNQDTYFSSIYDFLWLALSSLRDCSGGGAASSSVILDEAMVPYSLGYLQVYLNEVEPSMYPQDGLYQLAYPYALLLSLQFLPAVESLVKETEGDEGYNIDAVHILIALADHGVLSEGAEAAASMIYQYGAAYLRLDNLSAALEYYVQAASAMGGGELSWTAGGESTDQGRQRQLMLKELLKELLLCDGGISLLLGEDGPCKGAELSRFLIDKTAQQFLLEAASQCQDGGTKKRIHKYVSSMFGSSSTSQDLPHECTPGSKALAKREWQSSGGRCLFCKDKLVFLPDIHQYVRHQIQVHKKQYK